MVTIRTYQTGDYKLLIKRDGDDLGDGDFDEETGPTWTILVEGVPVTIFGLQYAGPGVYDQWGTGTEAIRGHGLFVVKRVREIMELAFENLDLHRIQATCRTDRPEYERFLKLLGFQKEGLLRQMAPDRSDLFIFSKVKS